MAASEPYLGLPSSPKNLKLLQAAIARELGSFMLIGDIVFDRRNGHIDVKIMDHDEPDVPIIKFQYGDNNSIRFYFKN